MTEERTRDLAPGPFNTEELSAPNGINHLFVIAIDEYEHCPVLHNCLKDAQGFIEVLKERYNFEEEHIHTLFNKEATRANIHAHFKQLKKEIKPEDSLVVYFSGHGETEDDVGYWVPVEAYHDHEWEFVSTNDIKSRLDSINSFHTFVIVDACFSGSLFASYRSVKAGNENKRSRLGLAASHTKERALDGTAGENSPFSTLLLKKLWENTGILSAHKLSAELIEEVHAKTRGRQTPVFKPLDVKGDDSGQYVFRLKADENSDWAACQKTETLAAYEAFLAKYPEGEYAEEAKAKIVVLGDEEAWKTAKDQHTISAYLQYRKENPDGKYRDQALEAIQHIEEDQSWRQAQRKKSIYGYEHYLEKYPNGRYKDEAKKALEALLSGHASAIPQPPKPEKKEEPVKKEEPKVKAPELEVEKEKMRSEGEGEKESGGNRNEKAESEPKEIPVAKDRSKEKIPIATNSSPPEPVATATSASDNRKYMMIGGGVLVVVLIVVGIIMSGGGTSEAAPSTEVFFLDGKYGYKDSEGKELLAAIYDEAEPFKDGEAIVTQNGQTFTIDKSGNCIANCPELENTELNDRTLSENTAAPSQPADDMQEDNTAKANTTEVRETKPSADKPKTSPKIAPYTGKTLKIGGLTWMAENLNVDVRGSWCYNESPSNCKQYGRLYTWTAANAACKAMGWRLPSPREWKAMGANNSINTLTKGGFKVDKGGFSQLDKAGYYWGSTENALGLKKTYTYSNGELAEGNNDARLGYSCRCVK